jgi:hypothetical protein
MHRRNNNVILLPLLISMAGCGNTSGEVTGTNEAILEEAVLESQNELSGCNVNIKPDHELVITHPSVVDDPKRTKASGSWTFARLMADLAKAKNVPLQTFVLTFLESWTTDTVVNGFTVPARPEIESLVIAPWRAASGHDGLDMDKAPMKLLAITNRVDLTGASGHAGEGRFVFGVLDANRQSMPFTIICEYKLPTTRGMKAVAWAREWHALGDLPLGSPEYNARLQAITDRFATADMLAQCRTNEIALAAPWELREFKLDNKGLLKPAPMHLTPDITFNETAQLAEFIEKNAKKIDAETHAVRPKFQGDRILAGSAKAPTPSFKWNAPGIPEDLRLKFSRNTCNGCHTGDTGTFFLHIGPGAAGEPARLSKFLVETDIPHRVANMKKLLCR